MMKDVESSAARPAVRVDPIDRPNAVFVSSAIYDATGYRRGHPLGIARIGSVHRICRALGWLPEAAYIDSPVAPMDDLCRLHSPDYVACVRQVGETGAATLAQRQRYHIGTMENPAFEGVFRRAATSVGGSMMAAEQALSGRIAYHPAGGTHHGRPDRASGFCYFNDPAFAILRLLDGGLERVLYADLDAHHGDGVQDFFAADPRVRTISVHEAGRWPGTGARDDVGQGFALNLPVPAGFNDTEMRFVMDEIVMPFAAGFAPQALVVTTGADALAGDPLSQLTLSNRALWEAVEQLLSLTPAAVVLGGGGYNPWTVARCWSGLWARLSGQPIPDATGAEVEAVLAELDCDLVEEDEIDPAWLTTIADARNEGPVRETVRSLSKQPESGFTRSAAYI